MLVIAHRGNNKEVLENSFSAYEKAVECGASRIELDVQLTRDGHAVINHDDHLIHTTGLNLYCSDLERSEFSQIELKNGESVPFLDQVVERFLPSIELNVEIKGAEVFSSIVAERVLRGNLHREKIIVSSFYPEPLKYFRDHSPDIKRACLVGDDEIHWPFFGHMAPIIFMNDVHAQILHPRFDQVSENLMDQAKSRNWQVFTWATMVGEDHRMESIWTALQAFGVDGHCTNYPREMIHWKKEIVAHDERINAIFKQA
jgi:glycerophosphoryl diester phosphodiesterase